MSNRPVFLHSLFRTGSTYIWNKFRRHGRYTCYYEPFHPVLALLTPQQPDRWGYGETIAQNSHHPCLEQPYHQEYLPLLSADQPGVPFFKKSFSFDEFCHNEANPAARQYIDLLLENAAPKIPLLQFNRTALRTAWFKENYPHCVHGYILRDARCQWESHLAIKKESDASTFLTMSLLTASINSNHHWFAPLAAGLPLMQYHSDSFVDEALVYERLLAIYSPVEQYTIFYYTWLVALIFNCQHADILLDIDQLSADPASRQRIVRELADYDVAPVSFEDACVKTYDTFTLGTAQMEHIEAGVQASMGRLFTKECLAQAAERLQAAGSAKQAHLQLPLRLENPPPPPAPDGLAALERRQQALIELGNWGASQSRDVLEQKERVRALDTRIKEMAVEKETALRDILSTNSYRLGWFLLAPVRWSKKQLKDLAGGHR